MNETQEATPESQPQPTPKPQLWNPNAAVNWSVIFTPIFGAWLHAKNWATLGDAEQAKKSMYWVYAGFAFLVLCLFLPDEVAYAPGLIFLVAWYFTAGRKQMKHVKEKLNNDYERKPWRAPMKFAVIGLAVFIAIAWIASPGIESTLEKESVGLVSQILADQADDLAMLDMEPAECVRVKITEEITDNIYRATATLDNGNDVTITITHEDDQILVKLNLANDNYFLTSATIKN